MRPVFVARFEDGQTTRMTISTARDKLDVGRGVRLARWAYVSRMKREPPAIAEARFVSEDDETLATYDAEALKGEP